MPLREENIVTLMLEGNEQGLRLLYRNYNEAIYGIIHHIVKSEQHAEEVLNDVFLKFYNGIKSYDPLKGRLFTWMARIARNAAIDKIRTLDYKSSRSAVVDISVQLNAPAQDVSVDHLGLAAVLKGLDFNQKRMIEMIYLMGYTHQECADELNMPLGTVKTNVRRGILKLREFLGNDLQAFISVMILILIYIIINN